MKPYATAYTKVTKIRRVRLILYVLHPYVQSINGKIGSLDFLPRRQKLKQTQRVLPAGQANEQTVAVFNQMIIVNRFVETTYDSLFKFLFYA